MKKITTYIVLLNLVLILGQIYLSARRATDGAALSHLYDETAAIEKENQRLKAEYYTASSLDQIQKRSADLQLSKVTAQFFTVTLPVAQAR